MKRPVKPFVVEHKRRSRSPSNEPPSIWSGALGEEMRSLVKEREEDESLPEPDVAPTRAVQSEPVETASKGRILLAREERVERASAIEDEPFAEGEDEPAPRPAKAPRVSRPRAEPAQKPRKPTPRPTAKPAPSPVVAASAAPAEARVVEPSSEAPQAAPVKRPPSAGVLRYLERRAGTKEQKLWQRWKRK